MKSWIRCHLNSAATVRLYFPASETIVESGKLYVVPQPFISIKAICKMHLLKQRFIEAMIVPEICVACMNKKLDSEYNLSE